MPNANKGLVMFEPISVPNDMPVEPFRIARMATVSSGSAVINPIIMLPIKESLTPQRAANVSAFVTTTFAEYNSSAKPMHVKIECFSMLSLDL